jgi:glycosyltransferase involved in cell wall biosynthesis
MRTLVVAELYPWPPVDGYRQRLHHLVGGLAEAGDVDVAAPLRPGQADPEPPPWDGVARTLTVPVGPPIGARTWGREWVRGRVPRRVLSVDWGDLLHELAEWRAERYDLVWYSHVHTWWPVHGMFPGTPSIVDFDNLENLAMRLRRTVPPRFDPTVGPMDHAKVLARWVTSRGFDLVDEGRWDRLQRECAEQVDHVAVCSRIDVERSGCANAVVVPNGGTAPERVRADRTEIVGSAPALLFVGALDYEPNTEAVEWFLREVWPRVRRGRPDAVVRIVGRGGEALGGLADSPGVELLGQVPDLGAELERADVSIVPIRVGAGTRLKVVEALANRLPLVTTTVGCEGIEVRDGESALIADDAPSFAGAVLRAVADGHLRQRLADAGAELFEAEYTWTGIRHRVAALARATAR